MGKNDAARLVRASLTIPEAVDALASDREMFVSKQDGYRQMLWAGWFLLGESGDPDFVEYKREVEYIPVKRTVVLPPAAHALISGASNRSEAFSYYASLGEYFFRRKESRPEGFNPAGP